MVQPMTRMTCMASCLLCCLVAAGAASAQVTVFFPDYSQRTTVSVMVPGASEQAEVVMPPGIGFNVTRIADGTASSPVSVTVSGISLGSSSKQLKISLQANAAAFTPPVVGAATWTAADVTWNSASWTNASGAAGTLSGGSFVTVATCAANVTSCSTSSLVFTLAPNTAVKRSGNHALAATWKFESIEP